MAENIKIVCEQIKKLAKENERFRKRTEIVTQRLQRDYAELIKSFYRLQVHTVAILEKWSEL